MRTTTSTDNWNNTTSTRLLALYPMRSCGINSGYPEYYSFLLRNPFAPRCRSYACSFYRPYILVENKFIFAIAECRLREIPSFKLPHMAGVQPYLDCHNCLYLYFALIYHARKIQPINMLVDPYNVTYYIHESWLKHYVGFSWCHRVPLFKAW